MSLYFCRNFITHINKKLKIMSKVTVVGAGNVGATCAMCWPLMKWLTKW